MPACTRRLSVRALLAATLVVYAAFARAELDVTLVDSAVVPEGLKLSAMIDTQLNPRVEEALNKGIALEIIIEVVLDEHRRIWWDPEISAWELRRRLEYHALSGQYLVGALGTQPADRFFSLPLALKHFGTIKDLVLPLKERIPPKGDYRIKMRVGLDIESLPAPLRPFAYTSPSWHLGSGWKKWKVGS